MMVRIQNEEIKSFPQPVVFVLSMDFIQFPMIFIFHSTHTVLSLLVSVPHKNSAKLLSNMSLIHWMFWAVPLMLLIQPIIPGSLFPVSWLMFPSSQWFPESCCFQLAWLRELGQLGSLTTRIIATQSLSSAAHQDKEFSTSNSKEIALPQPLFQLLLHTWIWNRTVLKSLTLYNYFL